MATAKWLARSSWANAFQPQDFNALANGAGILSTATAIDNTTNLHFYADLSFRMVTSTMTPTAGGHLAFYLLPLLDDGTTYPDSANTATAGDQPAITYYAGSMALRTTSGAVQNGMLQGLRIPPGVFKFYVINRAGVALPSSLVNMTCKYATYSEQA
jgi:hypothetical protein